MRSKLNKNKKIIIIVVISIILILAIIAIALYFTLKKKSIMVDEKNIMVNEKNIMVNENGMMTKFSGSFLGQNPPLTPITYLTGYWMWTWGGEGGGNPPSICDIGIRFGGEVPKTAIDNNINMASSLTSREKFLNLGGGLESGIWQLTDFDYINSKLSNIKSKGWTGVCFDIEVCPPSISFVNAFADCFAKCKAAGLKVLVTMSHTVPYGCNTGIPISYCGKSQTDAQTNCGTQKAVKCSSGSSVGCEKGENCYDGITCLGGGAGQGMDLVNAWIKDPNIDYLSPQLYTEGHTLEPTDLSMFSTAIAKIVPSIPYDTDWNNIQNLGIVPAGYLAWLRTKVPIVNYCGTSWANANTNCASAANCVSSNNECPSGQSCYTGITCIKPVNLCGTNWNTVNCSSSQKCPGGTNGECPQGQSCFASKCINLCGTNSNNVNCTTSQKCPGGTDGECPSGQKCWGNNTC